MFRKKSPQKRPQRKYHDGDAIKFDFTPNSLDVDGQEVTLIGVVTGALYEKDGIRYKVQLKDNKRNISGDAVIPENMINGKIEI